MREEITKMEPAAGKAPENVRAAGMDQDEDFQNTAIETESEDFAPLFPENFEGVLFIGDSRTVDLHEYGDLGNADVFADSGMSVFDLWNKENKISGKKLPLKQLLLEKKYQVIHIMLGINELGYPMDKITEKYREIVKEIQAMQPQANIVLGANLHVTEKKSAASDIYNNPRIDELNEHIKAIGQELSCKYIDVNEMFDDGNGSLAEKYSADGSHVLGKYYADWVQWIYENQIPL